MKNSELKSMKNDKEKAIAYIRVSTKEQKKDGNSLTSQKKYIETYAEKNNLELIDTVEESRSASKVTFNNIEYENNIYSGLKNRPKLLKIISSAKQSNFQHLIVSTRDRLARNLELFVSIKYFLMKKNISIHFANPRETINSENAGLQNFIELIFGSVAELESNLISDRVRDGMAQKVRQGYWPGGIAPYGYTAETVFNNGKEHKKLNPLITRQKYIEDIFKLHNHYGYSYRKIANILNEDDDIQLWNKSKIENIINNEVYTGKVTWGRRSRRKYDTNNDSIVYSSENKCSKIITQDDWDHAKNIRKKKSKIKDTKYFSTPFLLRDKLICGECGAYMKAKNYGYNRKGKPREGVYRCDCTKNLSNNKKMVFKKSHIENKFIKEFLINLTPTKINTLWAQYCITQKKILNENKEKAKKIDTELNIKRKRLNKLNSLLNDKSNSFILEPLKTQKVIINKEIALLESYKKNLNSFSSNSYKNEDELFKGLENLFTRDFNNLTQERKRMLIDMLINKIIIHKQEEDIILTIYMNSNIDIL